MARRKVVKVYTKAKKKRAVARATVKYPGSGVIRVNSRDIRTWNNKYLRMMVEEPILLSGMKVDARIETHGGGIVGQAVAARGALAKALVQINPDLKEKFLDYDRMLLVDDVRRTEPKKPLGPKARAKKQKSYR